MPFEPRIGGSLVRPAEAAPAEGLDAGWQAEETGQVGGPEQRHPAEAEAVLTAHPAVGDVAVIGIPDAEWGESVKAVVELADGYQPSDELGEELIAFCRGRLAGYKCPRSVDFMAQLPRTDGGKLFKRLLRDEYRRMAEAAD